MSVVHSFDPPDRFVAGTVGMPGERTFFLQARHGTRLVSVALEKQQVAVLAERVGELLDRLIESGETQGVVPAVTPEHSRDAGPLDQPVEEEFRVGTMTLSWDPADERIVIEIFPIDGGPDEDDDEAEPDEVLRVRLPVAGARAFAERAAQVVQAGRPDCPFCGEPIDPEGHLCVRANGYRRRSG